MKVFVVFAITVFCGCHANLLGQDQAGPSIDLVKNAFWNYVAQATLTAEDTMQMIKNSELGQDIR